ncbi:MAG TPA: prolipoprotein diacylglyceryl transferase [Thermoanaerobaculia bacterium]|nr:prolipoprotein diacylglyceryl transferase [Thermoanaerobaculia bacterium]
MYPELFRIGDFPISSFGLMLVLSFVAAYLQLRWGLRRVGAGDEDDAAALVFAAGFFGIVGAKLYYAVLYQDWRLLFDRSGLVWYGGFALAIVAVLWTVRRRRLPSWPTVDAMSLSLALGYAVGRVGCFLVGDDYGVPTSLPWGVVFPEGAAPPSTAGNLRHQFGVEVPAEIPDYQLLAVHPTQLYEVVACLAIWGFGLWALRRLRLPAGALGMTVLALLAVERFLVELLRAKDDRFLGVMTVAQAISLAVLAVAVALLARRMKGPRRPLEA